jgi:hypothetical protein
MDQLAITAGPDPKGEESATSLPKGVANYETCPCTVRLTVLNETSSGAYKFKLLAVLSGMELSFMDLILARADQSISIGR